MNFKVFDKHPFLNFFLVVFLVLSTGLSCSEIFKSNNSNPDTDDDLSPVQKFYFERAKVICQLNEKCCSEAGEYVVPAADCADSSSSESYGSTVQRGVDNGYITFMESRIAGCLDTLESLTCAQWKALIEGESLDACGAIFVANQDEGETCHNDESCKTHHCTPDPDKDGTGLEYGICDTRKSAGKECFSSSSVSHDCVSGYVCHSSIYTSDTCVPLLTGGESCQSATQCWGERCGGEPEICGPSCFLRTSDRTRNVLRHW